MIVLKITGKYLNGSYFETSLPFETIELANEALANFEFEVLNDIEYGYILDSTSITSSITELKELNLADLDAMRFRMALSHFNFRTKVEDFVSTCNDSNIQDAYNYATAFSINSHLLLGCAKLLNLSNEDLEALFDYGNSLEV